MSTIMYTVNPEVCLEISSTQRDTSGEFFLLGSPGHKLVTIFNKVIKRVGI
jgi:hypothetical protein